MSTAPTNALAQAGGGQVVKQSFSLKQLVEAPAYQKRFRDLLGDRTGQFCAALIQVGSSPNLKDAEPNSVIAAAITAAALDLPIDKNLGFAHIVPYKKKGVSLAQFQMGYKGFIQLAMRTGQYLKMNAKAINAEAFGGYDEVGDPIIKWDLLDETKEPVGYVFAWKMVNGFTKVIYWKKEKVEAHAKRYSQAYANGYETPWKTNFDAMALKTVIKDGIGHWGIMSVQMNRALTEDQGVRKDPDTEVEFPDNTVAKPAKLSDGSAPGQSDQAPIDIGGEKVKEPSEPEDQIPGAEVPAKDRPANVTDMPKEGAAETKQPSEPPPTAQDTKPAEQPAATTQPQQPAATTDANNPTLSALRKLMETNDVTEAKVVAFMRNKFKIQATSLQTIADSAPKKLTLLVTSFPAWKDEILAS